MDAFSDILIRKKESTDLRGQFLYTTAIKMHQIFHNFDTFTSFYDPHFLDKNTLSERDMAINGGDRLNNWL